LWEWKKTSIDGIFSIYFLRFFFNKTWNFEGKWFAIVVKCWIWKLKVSKKNPKNPLTHQKNINFWTVRKPFFFIDSACWEWFCSSKSQKPLMNKFYETFFFFLIFIIEIQLSLDLTNFISQVFKSSSYFWICIKCLFYTSGTVFRNSQNVKCRVNVIVVLILILLKNVLNLIFSLFFFVFGSWKLTEWEKLEPFFSIVFPSHNLTDIKWIEKEEEFSVFHSCVYAYVYHFIYVVVVDQPINVFKKGKGIVGQYLTLIPYHFGPKLKLL
jgi:hypothetical protein